MIRLKDGISLLGMASSVYRRYGHDTVVTSVTDGTHSATSLHYVGHAVDLRTRHVPETTRVELAEDVQTALGDGYDVVLEDTHLHVEWQPTRP